MRPMWVCGLDSPIHRPYGTNGVCSISSNSNSNSNSNAEFQCRCLQMTKSNSIKALHQPKLDRCEQHLLHNIFKVDQKSLSKLFMTFQQTFTCSKSTRETLESDHVLMTLFLTLNIIHTIFESLLLTLNKKMFIWIASSD